MRAERRRPLVGNDGGLHEPGMLGSRPSGLGVLQVWCGGESELSRASMSGYRSESDITVADPVEGICVVGVAGEIDLLAARTLQQVLARELGAGHQAVLVNLSACEFMG